MRSDPNQAPAAPAAPLPRPTPAPDRPSAQDLKVAILRTADVVRRRVGSILAGRGLTLHQYNVLRILRGARPEPLTRAQIAARTVETVPELVDLLADLAGRALVRMERGPDATDVHSITVAGVELLAELDAPVAEADRAVLGGLDGDQARGLIALLDRISGAAAPPR